MSKRTVTICNPCSISVKNQQLVIHNDYKQTTVPLEDIWVVILETRTASISSAALSEIVSAGIGMLTCDKTHHPNGLLLPIGAHSRHSAIVKHQLSMTVPFKKRLWQKIVKQKISNQAKCLKLLDLNGAEKIETLIPLVQSGDSTNRESQAAQIYFRNFLSDGTRRKSAFTSSLDYGYAIIRAGIARTAVSYGWLVSRGIHHDNELNPFNLVDDLIEAFRPTLDLMIASNPPQADLTPEYKRYLTTIHEYCVKVDDKEYMIQSAVNEVLESLKRAVLKKNPDLFRLPELIPLKKKRLE